MARYTGPVCKLCRREGDKLYLKGSRCLTSKCSFERRGYAPGQHGSQGRWRRRRPSDYSLQLREKQRARRIYGVLERQFRRYYKRAAKVRGLTGLTLMQSLESRLDNVVYRLGFAESRSQARLLVSHGHFSVNGHKTDIPSMLLKPGDDISVYERSRKSTYFQGVAEVAEARMVPTWLNRDLMTLSGHVEQLPSRAEIDTPVREQLIVEFYSR